MHPEFGSLVIDKCPIAIGGCEVYFDDITLTLEPDILSLLVIGGLAILRGRRK